MDSFSHQTLSSSPDDKGYSYWASFASSCFAKGSTSRAHKGVLNGTGPRTGSKAIVKAFRDEAGTEDRCDRELSKCSKATALAQDFNTCFGHGKKLVSFLKPLKALMDKVALMHLISVSRRKMSGEEWVLIEEYMGKTFQVFIEKNGRCFKDIALFAEAFVHFSYDHTGGNLVICGLKGRITDQGYLFKTPTIHSLDQSFGESDKGKIGILHVFERHTCNGICKQMLIPNVTPERPFPTPSQSIPKRRLQRQPSAPLDPEVFSDPSSPMVQFVLPSPPPYYPNPVFSVCPRVQYCPYPASCDGMYPGFKSEVKCPAYSRYNVTNIEDK